MISPCTADLGIKQYMHMIQNISPFIEKLQDAIHVSIKIPGILAAAKNYEIQKMQDKELIQDYIEKEHLELTLQHCDVILKPFEENQSLL